LTASASASGRDGELGPCLFSSSTPCGVFGFVGHGGGRESGGARADRWKRVSGGEYIRRVVLNGLWIWMETDRAENSAL